MSIRSDFSHYNHAGGHGTSEHVQKEAKIEEIDPSTIDCCCAALCIPRSSTKKEMTRITVCTGVGVGAGAIAGAMVPVIGPPIGAFAGGALGTVLGGLAWVNNEPKE
jgi:hypothetical protein